MKIKNALIFLIYLIIIAIVCVLTYRLFEKIFLSANTSFQVTSIGAFLGAFFAFIFIKISDFFLRITNRVSNNYKSLVRLQYYFNENISILDDNIYLIQNIISQFNIIIKDNKPIIVALNITEISIDKETIRSISKIDLANDLFSYNMRIRKLNQSIKTLKYNYEKVMNSFTDKNIEFEAYKLNIEKSFLNSATDLERYLKLCLDKTKDIFATIRILGKNRPFIIWLFQLLKLNYITKRQKQLIPDERTTLDHEINQIREESKKELDAIYNK